MDNLWTIIWDDTLLTGVKELDKLHEAIAGNANKIYAICINPGTKEEEIIKLAGFLKHQLMIHFDLEVDFYKKNKLQCYERHVFLHQEFKDELKKLDKLNMPIIVKALMTNQIALFYLKNHLIEEDKKCIKELKNKEV